ncbi:hypothetical protein HDU88_000891 [Geranomyces variabilis]|nr:hypothetical protein HDU88_000891 [Geranomyces variabilis]
MHNLPVEVLSEIFALVANTPPVPPVTPPSNRLNSWPTHRSQADLRACAEVCSFWRKVALRFQYAHVTVCSTRQLAMLRATLGVVPGRAELVRYLSFERLSWKDLSKFDGEMEDVILSVFARLIDLCGLCPSLRGLGVNDPAFWWRTRELVGQAHFTLAVNPPLSGGPERFLTWRGAPFKLLLTGYRDRTTHLHVGHEIMDADCCDITKYPLSNAFDAPIPKLHTISSDQTYQMSPCNLRTLLPKVVAMSFQIPCLVAVRGNMRLVVCLEDERDREAWALNAMQSMLDQQIRKHRTYQNLKIECIPPPSVAGRTYNSTATEGCHEDVELLPVQQGTASAGGNIQHHEEENEDIERSAKKFRTTPALLGLSDIDGDLVPDPIWMAFIDANPKDLLLQLSTTGSYTAPGTAVPISFPYSDSIVGLGSWGTRTGVLCSSRFGNIINCYTVDLRTTTQVFPNGTSITSPNGRSSAAVLNNAIITRPAQSWTAQISGDMNGDMNGDGISDLVLRCVSSFNNCGPSNNLPSSLGVWYLGAAGQVLFTGVLAISTIAPILGNAVLSMR